MYERLKEPWLSITEEIIKVKIYRCFLITHSASLCPIRDSFPTIFPSAPPSLDCYCSSCNTISPSGSIIILDDMMVQYNKAQGHNIECTPGYQLSETTSKEAQVI